MTERPLLPLIAAEAGCTLPEGEPDPRLIAWRTALAGSHKTSAGPDRLVLELPSGTDLPALARLCELEVGCCSFFAFSLEITEGTRRLVVRAPRDKHQVLNAFAALLD